MPSWHQLLCLVAALSTYGSKSHASAAQASTTASTKASSAAAKPAQYTFVVYENTKKEYSLKLEAKGCVIDCAKAVNHAAVGGYSTCKTDKTLASKALQAMYLVRC